MSDQAKGGPWLVLIHRLPPKPTYLRARIGRLLDRVGAVAVKNAVYVLPRNDEAQEDFQWIVKQIVQGRGEATVFEARFVDGLKDAQVERLFRDARDREFRDLSRQARAARPDSAPAGLRRRFDEIVARDFFGAPGRREADRAITELERRRRSPEADRPASVSYRPGDYVGRTWVTRKDVHVDRIACAWLIRRFIDPKAKFRFVPGKTHAPVAGEVRFDMFEGEFTHEGDKCSFEVLIERLKLRDAALRPLAEIVHDIDLKDEKFRRPETSGIEGVIRSIVHAHASDEERIERASAVLDDLRGYLKRGRA